MPSNCIAFRYPDRLPRSSVYSVSADGLQIPVLHAQAADIAHFVIAGHVALEVTRHDIMPHHAVLRPLARGKGFELTDQTLQLQLEGPGHWVLEFDEDWSRPLYIFAEAPEVLEPPEVSGPLRQFAAGEWHRPGPVELAPGESLWIEPGAVLEAPVLARETEDVVISGPGILLGSFQDALGVRGILQGVNRPTLQIAGSSRVTVRDLLVLDTRAWSTVCLASEDVVLHNHKSVSWSICDDGLDIVGSQRVRVEDSFIRSRDDCVSLKACNYAGFFALDGRRPVRDIEVVRSTFTNADCGGALEVGYETHCEEFADIRFHDCDILRSLPEGNRSGAAVSIHAGNEALIHDVAFESLRIEQALDKFVDLGVFESPYTRSTGIGSIRGVRVQDIDLLGGLLPRSFVHGFDDEHRIDDVLIARIWMAGARYRSILNTNHGIPTTVDPHPTLDATPAVRALTSIRHADVRFEGAAGSSTQADREWP